MCLPPLSGGRRQGGSPTGPAGSSMAEPVAPRTVTLLEGAGQPGEVAELWEAGSCRLGERGTGKARGAMARGARAGHQHITAPHNHLPPTSPVQQLSFFLELKIR